MLTNAIVVVLQKLKVARLKLMFKCSLPSRFERGLKMFGDKRLTQMRGTGRRDFFAATVRSQLPTTDMIFLY